MKNLIAVFVFSILLCSCNGFQHAHYRHVKKIPAKGDYYPAYAAKEKQATPLSSFFIVEGGAPIRKNNNAAIDPLPAVNNNRGYHPVALPEKRTGHRKNNFPRIKFSRHESISRKKDGVVFLVLLFLFLGICLIAGGIVMVFAGIYGAFWWLIPFGVVVFLLGLLPFIGMISFAAGDRYHQVPAYDEPPKKSAFPDHK